MSRVDEAMKRAAGGYDRVSVVSAVPRRSSREADAEVSVEDYPREHPTHAAATAVIDEPRVAQTRTPASAAIDHPRVAQTPSRPVTPPQGLARLAEEVEGKVVVDASTSVESIEEYRRLAGSVHQLQQETGIRTLMVSSALPKDGKTLTATNLAMTLSESYGRRVLLIDGDLRRPSVHHVFNLPNGKGLSDGLRGDAPGTLRPIEVSARLSVLPAGTPDHNPVVGLTSERMRTVIAEAASRFDWVILDSPPIGLMSDANVMAALVDGVVLVIGAGKTDYTAVKRAVAAFGRERIIGIVLNRVHEVSGPSEKYRDYYYQPSGSSGRVP